MMEKIKAYYKEHKTEIIFAAILGTIYGSYVAGFKKGWTTDRRYIARQLGFKRVKDLEYMLKHYNFIFEKY